LYICNNVKTRTKPAIVNTAAVDMCNVIAIRSTTSYLMKRDISYVINTLNHKKT